MSKKHTIEELGLSYTELYDILGETIRVCQKRGVPYFVTGGIAIGALYDQGILPQDDDIDIGMTRENYSKLLKVAPGELGPSYFLLWIETNPHTPYYFVKVKKNNILFVEEMFKSVPIHPGIFIDIFPFGKIPDNKLLRKIQPGALGFLKCCLMGKEIWTWKRFGRCEVENPIDREAFSCPLNRIVGPLFFEKAIYQMLVFVQSCFDSRNTRYYNNAMATADHMTAESIHHLQSVKFGPLTMTAPNDLEGLLRYNYPTLHRFTEGGQERINDHYPAVLPFNTTPKQGL